MMFVSSLPQQLCSINIFCGFRSAMYRRHRFHATFSRQYANSVSSPCSNKAMFQCFTTLQDADRVIIRNSGTPRCIIPRNKIRRLRPITWDEGNRKVRRDGVALVPRRLRTLASVLLVLMLSQQSWGTAVHCAASKYTVYNVNK